MCTPGRFHTVLSCNDRHGATASAIWKARAKQTLEPNGDGDGDGDDDDGDDDDLFNLFFI